MTAKAYKSLGVGERRVFCSAALVSVDIRKEPDAYGTARYVGCADLAADILDDTGSSSLSREVLMDILKGENAPNPNNDILSVRL